ncbi:hypothetical protein EBT31_14800 [bacterium]|nr:hypothetical protein [bacterium]NBX50024.1 hypothetical protein [bacterium]
MASAPQLTTILRAWPTVLLFSALSLVLAVVISLVQPLEYSSTTKILITPKVDGVDPYTASRSAESAADQLASLLSTSSLYTAVFNGGYNVDRSYFPDDILKFQKKWKKTVTASVTRGSGIMTIYAYHTDPEQAEALASAVAYVYVSDGWRYANGDISVQVIDDPVNSRYPVRPNILVNAFSGIFLGLIGGAGYVLIQADRVRRQHRIVHVE